MIRVLSGRGRLLATVSITVSTLALAGCTGSEEPSDPPSLSRLAQGAATPAPGGEEIDVPARLRPKPMPLDSYVGTPRETAILDYATQVLAAGCMQDRGFEVTVPGFDDLVEWHTWNVEHERSRTFGLTDRAAAATFGYGEAKPPEKPDPGLTDPDALAAYRGAGRNDVDGGCGPQAEAQVRDLSEPDYNASPLPVRLKIDASTRASARADYQAVYADLGRCLREVGYDVPDPERPFASRGMRKVMGGGMDRDFGEPAPPAEVEVALADIDCKVKVGLVRRLEAIVSEEEDELIDANALVLEEYEAERRAALRRATEIVNGGGA